MTVGVSSAATAHNWTFVQVQRVNSLSLRFDSDTFAPSNAFGGAFVGSPVQSQMQSALASSVANGSTSWLLEMSDLTDLSGTTDPSFHVGVLNASPAAPGPGNPVSYDGTSDLDWWYHPHPADLASDGSPIRQLTATFTAKVLNTGAGPVRLNTNLGGVPTTLAMSMATLQAVAGDASAPLTSTNGLPPGHLPEENLPDSLTSFESMSSGKLAGRISARSLAQTPIPAGFVGSGLTACTAAYTNSNTMLDLLITGCTISVLGTQVRATQPDTVDPAAGSGVYRFTTNGLTKQVTGCTHDAVPASLNECLDAAAYSSYFQFTTDRVIDLLQVNVSRLLTVARAGSGSGTVTSSPAGIDCGGDCTEPYDDGVQVTLTASPSPGSGFEGWTGCDNPSGTTCVMTMDADKQATASFVQQQTLSQRTFVSGLGSDANPCTRSAPCRTFAAAIARTLPGGEVLALDTAGYGPVAITKSISLISPPGVYAGITTTTAGTHGITIAAGVNDVVVLRGLSLSGLGLGIDGIQFVSGKALRVEQLTISGFAFSGLAFVPTGGGPRLTVTDSTMRDNGHSGIYAHAPPSVHVTVDGTRLIGNTDGLVANANVRMNVRDSLASGNVGPGFWVADATSVINLEDALVTDNESGILSFGLVRVAGTTITDNESALVLGPGASILSRGNNTVEGNTVDGFFTGPFAAK